MRIRSAYMNSVMMLIITAAVFTSLVSPPYASEWEIRRDDLHKERPLVKDGTVNVRIGEHDLRFPRYLNELGVKTISIYFNDPEPGRRYLSVVWTGGSMGTDKFQVSIDGILVGVSQTVMSTKYPYRWYRDTFTFQLPAGVEHILTIESPEEFKSAIEFTGIGMSNRDTPLYQPLCYESIGTLQKYEKEIRGKGTLVVQHPVVA